jgi:hypothetical protein
MVDRISGVVGVAGTLIGSAMGLPAGLSVGGGVAGLPLTVRYRK